MKKCIFISVRSDSTRLPNKATKLLFNTPTIQYLISNLKNSNKTDEIILCTTELESDDVLCSIAERNGIKYFRGSSEDKLARWLGACEKYDVDFFVNVDGDDLLFDYALADHVIEQYEVWRPDFIDGQGFLYNDVYGITRTALEEVCRIKGTNETEYIKPYFTETGKFFVQVVQRVPEKYLKTDARLTLDYPDDFKFFETVIGELDLQLFTFDNVSHILKNNPELKSINNHLEEEWKSNQERQKKFIFGEYLKDEL